MRGSASVKGCGQRSAERPLGEAHQVRVAGEADGGCGERGVAQLLWSCQHGEVQPRLQPGDAETRARVRTAWPAHTRAAARGGGTVREPEAGEQDSADQPPSGADRNSLCYATRARGRYRPETHGPAPEASLGAPPGREKSQQQKGTPSTSSTHLYDRDGLLQLVLVRRGHWPRRRRRRASAGGCAKQGSRVLLRRRTVVCGAYPLCSAQPSARAHEPRTRRWLAL